ncbi:two pore domain potassium channel family protein [Bacillus aquiflavi]|uniref:Two pore domain potassium channel family protein n=1 Tax=Bacillus aquiflavi TaxID=2672567 RepID=A0A6B3VWH3_9BACI|nr:two pore domain potassium channel family protein [Bacillus aquiflavi]MBA4536297.1 two pore domain potassium channel family protein [Bacillus aquiflavi]NEY80665.1 two pore domain potassium channel family protein [Bacillus aquiflavi]
MVYYLFFVIVVIVIYLSLRTLFTPYKLRDKHLSFENFMFLVFIYLTILIGFGLIYMILELRGYDVLLDNGLPIDGNFFVKLQTVIYFSGITLFSVGYGDVAPLGIARGIAVIEALIGYAIPAAFVVRTFVEGKK